MTTHATQPGEHSVARPLPEPPTRRDEVVRTEYRSQPDADVVRPEQGGGAADGPERPESRTAVAASSALSESSALSAAAVKPAVPVDASVPDARELEQRLRLRARQLRAKRPNSLAATRLSSPALREPAALAHDVSKALTRPRECSHRRLMATRLPARPCHRLRQGLAFQRRDDGGVRPHRRLALEQELALRQRVPHRGDGASEQQREL